MKISRAAVTSVVIAIWHVAPLVAIAAILVLFGAAAIFLPWFARQPPSARVDIIRLVSALRRDGYIPPWTPAATSRPNKRADSWRS
jgi:hypothetical protein